MTISSQNRQAGPFVGNDTATAFPFAFKVFIASDLQVVRTNSAGVESTLVLNTDYTVTLNSNQDSNPGGTVTLPTALATGYKLTATSSIAPLQATDLTNQGGFYPKVITNALDKLTILIQQILNGLGRSIKFPISDSSVGATLPSATQRANTQLLFDANGNPYVAAPASGSAADVLLQLASVAAGKGISLNGVQDAANNFPEATKNGEAVLAALAAREIGRSASKDAVAANNTTDDRAKIQAGISSLGVFGGRYKFKRATYKLGAHAGSALILSVPASLEGEGGQYTALNPSGATSSDNTLRIDPDPSYAWGLLRLSGIALHDPSVGTRIGKHGVYALTTSAGQQLPKLTLRDMIVGQGSGYGVYHLNTPASNVNGGLYCGLVENCEIKGGIGLESSGDSNSIVHNVLSGTGWGVWASLVPGASLLEIQANNITASYGAIRLRAGSRYRILGNNIEHYAAGAAANNDSAVIDISGEDGTMYGGVIAQNLVSAFGSTDATTLIRLRNSRGVEVRDNVLLSGSATTTTGIDIGNDCQDVRVGPNTFNAGITTQVNDNGVGTMGVVKTAALQNSWVAFAAGQSTLKFIKSTDGMVHVFGVIKNGTTANGTLVATLPVGFRPSEIHRIPIMVVNGGTPQIAEMTIESDGSMRINYVLSSNQLDINFSFPAANIANATSFE